MKKFTFVLLLYFAHNLCAFSINRTTILEAVWDNNTSYEESVYIKNGAENLVVYKYIAIAIYVKSTPTHQLALNTLESYIDKGGIWSINGGPYTSDVDLVYIYPPFSPMIIYAIDTESSTGKMDGGFNLYSYYDNILAAEIQFSIQLRKNIVRIFPKVNSITCQGNWLDYRSVDILCVYNS